jgi:hypothetical protein
MCDHPDVPKLRKEWKVIEDLFPKFFADVRNTIKSRFGSSNYDPVAGSGRTVVWKQAELN